MDIHYSNFNFRSLWRPSWILAENKKRVNFSETVRDRAILSEFFAHRVLQGYTSKREKFQFLPFLAAILDFSRK